MQATLQNLNRSAIASGLIIGALFVAIGVATYYMAPALMGSTSNGVGIMMISWYMLLTLNLRKKIGGYWNFKTALKGLFLMSFIACLVSISINYVFYKFVEPGAYNSISDSISERMISNLKKSGMEQEFINKAISEKLETIRALYDPTLLDLVRNFGIAVLIGFILALIFAAICKKEQPIIIGTEE